MPTHVALLRGVNVGGRNRLAMSDLRDVAASLGFDDVATYVQSGNLVFASPETDGRRLADALERRLAQRTDVRTAVVVVSRAELATVCADNPYPKESNPKCLYVGFFGAALDAAAAAHVAAAQQRAQDKGSRDQATVAGRYLYLRTPDGLGRSELAAQLNRAPAAGASAPVGTMRNWATVTKLLAMLEA